MKKLIYPFIVLFLSTQIISCKAEDVLFATATTLGVVVGVIGGWDDVNDSCRHSCDCHKCRSYH